MHVIVDQHTGLRVLQHRLQLRNSQAKIERHENNLLRPFDEPAKEYKVFTKYVYITNIKFAFAPYHDKVTVYYVQPHSEKIEEVCWGWNDFMRIKLMENEGDFRLLVKFYPIKVESIETPQLNFICQPAKERKVRISKNNSLSKQ